MHRDDKQAAEELVRGLRKLPFGSTKTFLIQVLKEGNTIGKHLIEYYEIEDIAGAGDITLNALLDKMYTVDMSSTLHLVYEVTTRQTADGKVGYTYKGKVGWYNGSREHESVGVYDSKEEIERCVVLDIRDTMELFYTAVQERKELI